MASRFSLAWGVTALLIGLAVSNAAQGQQVAGVQVDPDGVLRMKVYQNDLTRQRIEAARATLDPKLAGASELRKISLNRLEAVLAERLRAGMPPTEEMAYLAGLTRVQNVFFYPETGDVVIAGPAEGFLIDASGRARGIETGRATVLLEDLVAALRAYPPSGEKTPVISVSIDPTREGLAQMQNFLANIAGRVTPRDAGRIVQGLRESLGMQAVSIRGVSPRTHFAQVLVEADYRMKLIGIGIEQPPVKIVSYVERANPRDVSRNALQRWYFIPNYECLRVSEDELAMELVGDGVKLVNSDELVQAGGVRVESAAAPNRASKAFTENFTAMYSQLAAEAPVYAQLRNLIDLSVAAAFIQQQDFYGQAAWQMPVLGDESQFSIEKYETPRHVETACTAVWKGNTLMTPIGGGVNIQPRQALKPERRLPDENGELQALRAKTDITALPKDHWWWD
jgi:hypothetical protein